RARELLGDLWSMANGEQPMPYNPGRRIQPEKIHNTIVGLARAALSGDWQALNVLDDALQEHHPAIHEYIDYSGRRSAAQQRLGDTRLTSLQHALRAPTNQQSAPQQFARPRGKLPEFDVRDVHPLWNRAVDDPFLADAYSQLGHLVRGK